MTEEEINELIGFMITYKDETIGEVIHVSKAKGLIVTIDQDNDVVSHYFDGRARSPFSNVRNIIFPKLEEN